MITNKTTLEQLDVWLSTEGFETHMVKSDESEKTPLDVLFVELNNDKLDRDRNLEMAFIPGVEEELGTNISLLQLFVLFPFEVKPSFIVDTGRLILSLNLTLPLGSLGISEAHNAVLYRQVLLLGIDPEENSRLVVEAVKLTQFLLDQFSDIVETVAQGKKTLADIINESNAAQNQPQE